MGTPRHGDPAGRRPIRAFDPNGGDEELKQDRQNMVAAGPPPTGFKAFGTGFLRWGLGAAEAATTGGPWVVSRWAFRGAARAKRGPPTRFPAAPLRLFFPPPGFQARIFFSRWGTKKKKGSPAEGDRKKTGQRWEAGFAGKQMGGGGRVLAVTTKKKENSIFGACYYSKPT